MKTKKIDMTKRNIYIVIPGLNEEKHISEIIDKLKEQGFKNIVFVDDGSSDSSSKKAVDAGAIVLKHLINLGKGAAAKTGCDYALKKGAGIIILMDADGQHRPEDAKKLIAELLNKKADLES